MAKVTGIGGFFFRARDPKALATWYETHLGIDDIAKTVWRQQEGPTVFTPFAENTDYFGRAGQQWLINFRVDDLDGTLTALREEGCQVMDRYEDSEQGKFGYVMDPEGGLIELWQPAAEDSSLK